MIVGAAMGRPLLPTRGPRRRYYSSAKRYSLRLVRSIEINVRFGSISTEFACLGGVRFTPDSDRIADIAGGPICARVLIASWLIHQEVGTDNALARTPSRSLNVSLGRGFPVSDALG